MPLSLKDKIQRLIILTDLSRQLLPAFAAFVVINLKTPITKKDKIIWGSSNNENKKLMHLLSKELLKSELNACERKMNNLKKYPPVLHLNVYFLLKAFNKCKREGFRLQTVDKAPLAKRRKMKKTSTSTETRSSSSESTHSSSSSSQSQEKTFPEGDANPQPSNSTPVNTPVALGTDSELQPAHPAFHFSEGQ